MAPGANGAGLEGATALNDGLGSAEAELLGDGALASADPGGFAAEGAGASANGFATGEGALDGTTPGVVGFSSGRELAAGDGTSA